MYSFNIIKSCNLTEYFLLLKYLIKLFIIICKYIYNGHQFIILKLATPSIANDNQNQEPKNLNKKKNYFENRFVQPINTYKIKYFFFLIYI